MSCTRRWQESHRAERSGKGLNRTGKAQWLDWATHWRCGSSTLHFRRRNHQQSYPVPIVGPGHQMLAHGYDATLLVEVCEAFLKARDDGNLSKTQMRVAQRAEIILRSCAKVGIIALIDEATGYQEVRQRNALQLKLQAFISDDIQEWAKLFPDDFWNELARLEHTRYSPRNRPLRWGKYVMAFVYDAVDGDVGRELRKVNPNPHFRKNHHQWLRTYGREKSARPYQPSDRRNEDLQ